MTARSLFWPTAFTLAGLVVLIGLGSWQLQRLEWKNGLIAMVAARAGGDAVAVPSPSDWDSMSVADWEYRPVTLTGTFDHDREIHVFTSLANPRGKHSGPGYWVIAPLALEGGGTVMVNRGFVPEKAKDRSTREQGLVAGPQALTGLLRKPEQRGWFVPENDVTGNVWYYRDIDAMKKVSGTGRLAPFLVDVREPSPPGGLPQPGETLLRFKNNHLQYAITWFALAACLIAVFGAFVRKARRP